MAKVGESDPRWIVTERADGANVHGWHWQEKDCIEWAKGRLSTLLGGVDLLTGQGAIWARTTGVTGVTGECFVNMRKGKLIPGYELAVVLSWAGEIREGGQADGAVIARGAGSVDIPYLADENADEDPEVRVSAAPGGGAAGGRLRDAVAAVAPKTLHAALRVFVRDLAAGGPGAGGMPATAAEALERKAVKDKAEKAERDARAAAQEKALAAGGGHTIEMTEEFGCRPGDLYEAFTHPGRLQAFTQAKAVAAAAPGGAFSLFDGAITGEYVELDPGRRIVQRWRGSSWADGVVSIVSLELAEPKEGVTRLKLKQTGVPDADRFGNANVLGLTETGWRGRIFGRIKQVFGWGA